MLSFYPVVSRSVNQSPCSSAILLSASASQILTAASSRPAMRMRIATTTQHRSTGSPVNATRGFRFQMATRVSAATQTRRVWLCYRIIHLGFVFHESLAFYALKLSIPLWFCRTDRAFWCLSAFGNRHARFHLWLPGGCRLQFRPFVQQTFEEMPPNRFVGLCPRLHLPLDFVLPEKAHSASVALAHGYGPLCRYTPLNVERLLTSALVAPWSW